jgi:hypothetical protein
MNPPSKIAPGNFASTNGSATAAILANLKKTEQPEAEIVRRKITDAFPTSGILVHWHRPSEGKTAYYTMMAPVGDNAGAIPNELAEKFGGPMANQELWNKLEGVERWTIEKDFFSKKLTSDIPREQSFASLTPQIIGNIRHTFPKMRHAQFSGEGGTHYIIDGVEPGMEPAELLPGHSPAVFKTEDYWRVKIPSEDMRAALNIEAPAQTASAAKAKV